MLHRLFRHIETAVKTPINTKSLQIFGDKHLQRVLKLNTYITTALDCSRDFMMWVNESVTKHSVVFTISLLKKRTLLGIIRISKEGRSPLTEKSCGNGRGVSQRSVRANTIIYNVVHCP